MMNNLGIAFAIILPAGALVGCFTRASEQYACVDNDDCNGGRICGTANFCVIPDDGGAGSDDMGDMGDPCMTFGARHFVACDIPRPSGPMSLTITTSPYIFDTTAGTLLDPNNVSSTPPSTMVADGRVVSVDSFSLAAGVTLRVRGNTPLIIASWSTLEVSGTVDASSKDGMPGAGAQPFATPSTFCTTHQSVTPPQENNGGGGGGGGAMQSNGGNGGDGNNGANNGGTGAVGAMTLPPPLAAGCAGGKGGDGGGGTTGGAGGLGGGAIQLTARTSISIATTGRINAGGQGGRPAIGGAGGGGGGGAGGMIGLETPSLAIMPGAILAANGGGAGQGGGNGNGRPNQPGQDGKVAAEVALGGKENPNGSTGGNGGDGSISTSAGTNGANDGAGGGGGGGGAGYITVKAMSRNDSGATFSPIPTVIQ
jgi:hypothetical protein